MQLNPLPSRLAAFLAASCLLNLVPSPPNFALAAEVRGALPVVFDDLDFPTSPAARSVLNPTYEPGFSLFDRSLIDRAPEGVTPLTPDEPMPMNVDEGTTQHFVFVLPAVSERGTDENRLELRSDHNVSREKNAGAGAAGQEVATENEEQTLARRQASRTVYISANTCKQPQPIDPSSTTLEPPQLTLYVSKTPSNQAPGPLADLGTQELVVFNEGAVVYNFTTDQDVYIGIHAPNVSEVFSGTYNFRVAASMDGYYYSYNNQDKGDFARSDSDSQGALLITNDLTDSPDPTVEQQIMSDPPYVLFAHSKEDRAINGLKYSYCGLENYAQIAALKNGRQTETLKMGMTKRGPRNLPRQQFFFSGLNSSTDYIAILATDGWDGGALGKRQTVEERGPQVFREFEFRTKSSRANCALIVDLAFCDQVAYAVPSNPNFGNSTQLAEFYDNYASSMYTNFNNSLAQIACEAPSSQRYSLARNCTDCAAAYKDWLCSVAIPRCEDASNQAPHLQLRAISQPFPDGSTLDAQVLAQAGAENNTSFNSSRNPLIDSVIKPGPYKELLPCDSLCYNLVQSCPAALGFGCPLPGGIGFRGNYGTNDPDGKLTCNIPESAHVLRSGAGRAGAGWGLIIGAVGVVGLLVV